MPRGDTRSNRFPHAPRTASTCCTRHGHAPRRGRAAPRSVSPVTSRSLLRGSTRRQDVMFNVVHQGRKYVPVRSSVTEDSPVTVRTLGVTRSPGGATTEPPQATWPPPGVKLRGSKTGKGAAVMKAVRAHLSPPPGASVEGKRGRERSPGSREGPHRARKRGGFRAPDVRTIFSPGEKDPRVRQESGEGHAFRPGGEDTWCDVCCRYIFQRGVTCAGESRACQGGTFYR